jgi:glyoxylase-like metal-dependent hydrolase (beta-lactamase superfamily II)
LAVESPQTQGYLALGVFKMDFGTLTIYSFADRLGRLDFSVVQGVEKTEIAALVGQNPEMDASSLTSYVSVFVVKGSDGLYLVDTGLGLNGNLANYLKIAGFTPDDVTDVFLTHFHGDHINGLISDGQALFPNAFVWASESEDRYWLKGGANSRGQSAEEKIAPYRRAGRYNIFKPGQELKPGIKAVELYGHTPGHVGFLFKAGPAGEFLAWGDIVHAYLLQFQRPEITMTYDVDPQTAAKTRREIFAAAAATGYLVAGVHLPFPSLGWVKGDQNGFSWRKAE